MLIWFRKLRLVLVYWVEKETKLQQEVIILFLSSATFGDFYSSMAGQILCAHLTSSIFSFSKICSLLSNNFTLPLTLVLVVRVTGKMAISWISIQLLLVLHLYTTAHLTVIYNLKGQIMWWDQCQKFTINSKHSVYLVISSFLNGLSVESHAALWFIIGHNKFIAFLWSKKMAWLMGFGSYQLIAIGVVLWLPMLFWYWTQIYLAYWQ